MHADPVLWPCDEARACLRLCSRKFTNCRKTLVALSAFHCCPALGCAPPVTPTPPGWGELGWAWAGLGWVGVEWGGVGACVCPVPSRPATPLLLAACYWLPATAACSWLPATCCYLPHCCLLPAACYWLLALLAVRCLLLAAAASCCLLLLFAASPDAYCCRLCCRLPPPPSPTRSSLFPFCCVDSLFFGNDKSRKLSFQICLIGNRWRTHKTQPTSGNTLKNN